MDYQKYGNVANIQRWGDENRPTYTMQTVRGCVAACTFCTVRSFYGKGVRSKSAQKVLDEFDYAYNELGLKQVELEWEYLLHNNPAERMNRARQFRKSGRIEV